MATKQQAPPGQALELRPQERALAETARGLGILQYNDAGRPIVDLSRPELADLYNILYPAAFLMPSDPNFTPVLTVVRIDGRDGAGDVYGIEYSGSGNSRRMKAGALLKVALEKLGRAAGLVEDPPQIARDQDGITITAAVRARRGDGTYGVAYGTREWVTEDEREKVLARCPATKYNSDQPLSAAEKAAWFNKEWARVKESRLAMTESKAYNRAYRKALNVKAKYTPEELEKPFLVVGTLFTPDTSDLRVLGMLMSDGARATNLLYGPGPADDDVIEGTYHEEEKRPALTSPENVDRETGEVLEGTVEEEEPQGHGTRPTEDPVLPSGPHEGKPVSHAARVDPDYVKKYLVGSSSAKWGTAAEEWLAYWHGEGGDDDIPFA